MFYRPYPRRLESLTVCRCYYKGSISPQLFKDPECWSGRDLNLRPPTQQAGTNPIELTGQRYLDVQLKLYLHIYEQFVSVSTFLLINNALIEIAKWSVFLRKKYMPRGLERD